MRHFLFLAVLLAASPALAASPSPLPVGAAAEELPIMPYLIQLMVITGIVTALGFFSVRWLQAKVPGVGMALGGHRKIRLIDRLAVDPKRMVFIVNVGERYWLLAASDEHVTTVAELKGNELEAPFAHLVEQEHQRGENS